VTGNVTAVPGPGDVMSPTRRRPEHPASCPSVHRPFDQLDGSLIRVRLPGGVLGATEALGLARVAAGLGATLEITSRANLQIRGVDPSRMTDVVARLVAVGVTEADPAVDERRNIVASPTAGTDPTELIDVRPLVDAIAYGLGSLAVPGLSPKFCVLVDGGGAVHVRGRRHDVCLGAVRLAEGSIRFELRVAAALTLSGESDDEEICTLVLPEQVVQVVLAAARLDAVGGGISAVVERHGRAGATRRLERRAGTAFTRIAASRLGPRPGPCPPPLGPLPQRQAGLTAVGAMPVLGRLDPPTLEQVARLARSDAGGEIRLTPWRSLLLPGAADPASLIERLVGLGLVCDPEDPATKVIACAGGEGCPAGMVDTQADGRRLVALLRQNQPSKPLSVHLSGCPKRCASREVHDLTLIGGPEPGIYSVYGPAPGRSPGPGRVSDRLVAAGVSPEAALGMAVAAAAQSR